MCKSMTMPAGKGLGGGMECHVPLICSPIPWMPLIMEAAELAPDSVLELIEFDMLVFLLILTTMWCGRVRLFQRRDNKRWWNEKWLDWNLVASRRGVGERVTEFESG